MISSDYLLLLYQNPSNRMTVSNIRKRSYFNPPYLYYERHNFKAYYVTKILDVPETESLLSGFLLQTNLQRGDNSINLPFVGTRTYACARKNKRTTHRYRQGLKFTNANIYIYIIIRTYTIQVCMYIINYEIPSNIFLRLIKVLTLASWTPTDAPTTHLISASTQTFTLLSWNKNISDTQMTRC